MFKTSINQNDILIKNKVKFILHINIGISQFT